LFVKFSSQFKTKIEEIVGIINCENSVDFQGFDALIAKSTVLQAPLNI
jgi:hypothetical protein